VHYFLRRGEKIHFFILGGAKGEGKGNFREKTIGGKKKEEGEPLSVDPK